MLTQQHNLEIFADFFQFYLRDSSAPDYLDWPEEAWDVRVTADDTIIGICPARNMVVPVGLEVHDTEPVVDLADYHHAVLCSINLVTGTLYVGEVGDLEPFVTNVPAAVYDVLVLFSGLDTLDYTGLAGKDRYRILMWPTETARSVEILKKWCSVTSASDFSHELHGRVVDENTDIYLKMLRADHSTMSGTWAQMNQLFANLDASQQAAVARMFRQVIVDTVSSVLLVLDERSCEVNSNRQLNLLNNDGVELSGDLQDSFLAEEELRGNPF